MKRKSFNPGTLLAPVPPAMVTVGTLEEPNVLTVAWTGILATHPAKAYVSIRPSRHSYGILKEGGEFVINLPSASLARAVDYVGIYTGAKVDKFKACGITAVKSEKVAPPTVGECPVALECVVTEVIPMGTHDVFIADIVSVSCREELLDEEGKLHFERGDLLAYVHGEYYTLGERVGRFGFSTDKPKGRTGSAVGGARAFTKSSEALMESKGAGSASAKGEPEGTVEKKKAFAKGEPEGAVEKKKASAKGEPEGAVEKKKASVKGEAEGEEKSSRPFYLDAPRKSTKAKPKKDKDKGKRKGKN